MRRGSGPMTSSGMVRKRRWVALGLLTIIAVGVGAIALTFGRTGYGTVEHLPARPGRDEARAVRFESSRPWRSAVRGPWIGLSDLIPIDAWPKEVRTQYHASQQIRARGGAPQAAIASTRRLQFGGPRGRSLRSIWCGGRALLFHSARLKEKRTGISGLGPTRRFFDLAVIDVDDATDQGREMPLLEIVEGPLTDWLPFAVAAIDTQLRLVYITNSTITERRGRVTAAGLELDEPTVLGPFRERAGDLFLLATSDAFHMVWSAGSYHENHGYRLFYQRADRDGGWERPILLTESANRRTANLLVDGEDVFVAWSDHRFQEWAWDGPENMYKIFVQRISGHDRRLGRPVLMSDPDDRSDWADRLFLAATQDELVIYWSGRNSSGQPWHRAAIDRSLTTLTPLDPLDHRTLMEDYVARLRWLDGEGRSTQAVVAPPVAD